MSRVEGYIYKRDLKNFDKFMEDKGYKTLDTTNEYEFYRGIQMVGGVKKPIIIYAKANGRVTLSEVSRGLVEEFLNSKYHEEEEKEAVGLETKPSVRIVKSENYWNEVTDYSEHLKRCYTREECEKVLNKEISAEMLKDIIFDLVMNWH